MSAQNRCFLAPTRLMPSPFWGCAGGAMRPNARFSAFACGRQKTRGTAVWAMPRVLCFEGLVSSGPLALLFAPRCCHAYCARAIIILAAL